MEGLLSMEPTLSSYISDFNNSNLILVIEIADGEKTRVNKEEYFFMRKHLRKRLLRLTE